MTFDAKANRPNLILLWSGLVFYWGLCLWFFSQSNTPVDPSDGVYHYQISRFSWQNPANLLNHWGKPLFNILSSPFAQFGYIGMVVFNLILFSLSSVVLYKMAKHFSLAFAGLSPFLLMSSPVYFTMVNAGMTEILMAFLTLWGAYLFIKDRKALGAVVISLTIVSRPESVVIIPLYAFILLLSKNWKLIPLLLTGFTIFSLWGYLSFDKELLWVIHEDPYPFSSPYGKGSPYHFLIQYKEIFGLLLAITGAATLMIFIIKKTKSLTTSTLSQVLLFLLSTIMLVLLLHSFLWWQGLKGSLGLIRVMATVIPAMAFCTMLTINQVNKSRYNWMVGGITLIAVAASCKISITNSGLPATMDERSELLAEAAKWYKESGAKGRVSYLSPFFAFKADINPEDPNKVVLLWSLDKEDPSKSLSPGDIIVWDSQFGPLEGQIPEKNISENPNLKIKKYYEADTAGLPKGELPFRIYVVKVKDSGNSENSQ